MKFVRVDTIINTNVLGFKVYALAFVKTEGVTDSFSENEIRIFALPKLTSSVAIVQLDNVNKAHAGSGDEAFTGILKHVFSDGVSASSVEVDTFTDISVYFFTMDGINETVSRVYYSISGPKLWRLRITNASLFNSEFDVDTNTNYTFPHGIYDTDGNNLLENHNPDQNYTSLYDSISDRYTLYKSNDALVSSTYVNSQWFKKGSFGRLNIRPIGNGDYILMGFTKGLYGDQISYIGMITDYAPRLPREMVLEYYTGELENGVHDPSAWVTWSTLSNTQTTGRNLWSNITQGATIAAIK